MVPDDTRKDTTSSDISRRRALQLAAGGSALALAGCSGNDGSNGGGNGDGGGGNQGGGGGGNGGGAGPSESGSGQMTDKTFTSYITSVPTDIQFNPLSTTATDFYVKGAVYAWTAQVSSSASPPQYMPMVAKNWEVNGDTFTIELNDSFTWHDGKSLTAEDLSLQYNLDRFMGAGKYYGVWDFVDSVEATGEYTVEMALKEAVNPSLIVGEALGEPIAYEPKTHGKFLERFRNASSEGEKEQIRKEVTELTIKEPVGAGPVKFVSADAQKMVFEPHEEYPFEQVQQQFSEASGADITGWPDSLNFKEIQFKYIPTDRLTQEIRSGGVDAGRSTSSVTQLPPNYEEVAIPGLYGWSLLFNFWDSGLDDWEDPNVRKAFAHVLDRKAMAVQFMNEEAQPDELITGMTKSQEDEWLSSSFKNKLDPYELSTQKATQYLERSDYTKQNGKWMKPSGEPFVVKLKTASDVTNYVNGLQVAASNLKEFGIETDFQTEESTTYFSKEGNEQGYQIEAGPDYGGSGPDPYGAFDFIYRKEYIQPGGSGEQDFYLPGDETLEVPPVGQPDSDERVTIDPYAKLTELGKATDEGTQTKLVEELAWATNQSVPMITVTEAILEGFLHTDGWEYPPVDSPPVNMKSAAFVSLMLQSGIIKATQ